MKHWLILLFLGVSWSPLCGQTVGLIFNDSLSMNGYTLFAPNFTTTYLMDNCGQVVHTWESDFQPGNSVYLLENGNLLRPARLNAGFFNAGGTAGRVELFNWEGDLIWSYNYISQEYRQHHDVEPLPNGNILLLAWELKSATEAIAAGRDPDLTGASVWPEHIIEVEPVGNDEANIVWEWYLWDHIVQEFDATKPNFGVIADHPELIDLNFAASAQPGPAGSDWIHANAIQYNAELDQIAISSRNFDEIWIIDHSTTTEEAAGHTGGNSGKGGDILYRWGNPAAYQRGTIEDKRFFNQHDVRWIPAGYPGEGQLMVFNNGVGPANPGYSTVDVWQPPMDDQGNYTIEEGQPFGPEELTWQYRATPDPTDFFSQNISGATRLENGNTLICEGRLGRFFEVTESGEIVWQYINPVTPGGPVAQGTVPSANSVFRITRYPVDYPAFDGKDLMPGAPIELNPTPVDCIIYDDTVVNTTDIKGTPEVQLLTNPVRAEIHLTQPTSTLLMVTVFNTFGQIVYQTQTQEMDMVIGCAGWPTGTYFLHLSDKNKAAFQTLKVIKL
jgi:hypothetical protein